MSDKLSAKVFITNKALVNAQNIKNDLRQLRNTLGAIGYDDTLDLLTNGMIASIEKVCHLIKQHANGLNKEIDGEGVDVSFDPDTPPVRDFGTRWRKILDRDEDEDRDDENRCKFTTGYMYMTDSLIDPVPFTILSRYSVNGKEQLNILIKGETITVTPQISVGRFWLGRATEYISYKGPHVECIASSTSVLRPND